jgi:hypothetical protein
LAQACAAEQILEALLTDLFQDVRNGAARRERRYALAGRFCPPRAVVRLAKRGDQCNLVALTFRPIRPIAPITDQRLEQAFAAESLLDAMLGDLYRDFANGAAVVSRGYRLIWRNRLTRATQRTANWVAG